jgi:hypothetical protein
MPYRVTSALAALALVTGRICSKGIKGSQDAPFGETPWYFYLGVRNERKRSTERSRALLPTEPAAPTCFAVNAMAGIPCRKLILGRASSAALRA